MKPNQKMIDMLGHCARRAYLSTPETPAVAKVVVLVLFVDGAAMAIVLDTETSQFEDVVRDVYEGENAEHVLSYKDREAGGLLRVVAEIPEGILRFRIAVLPGAAS